jgi:DNA-binding transcriptional LysR family regulator
MDLNHVVAFARVVECGSFTSAASSLRLPKSSVSRSVAQLEAELGVQLLHRTTRKLRLTDAGRTYFEHARVALAGLDEARALAADLGKEPRGTVRVTAPVDVGSRLLSGLVARFLKRHPLVRVELSLTARTVDLVQEGFDLAVRAGKLADSSLIARKIATTGLGLWASHEYVKERGKPRSVAELSKHDCVIFPRVGPRSTWRLVGPEGEVEVDVGGRITVDELSFVREVVLAGAGIGLLPRFLADTAPRELVRILPRFVMAGTPLSVVSPPVRYEAACVALFREWIVKELTAVAARGAL